MRQILLFGFTFLALSPSVSSGQGQEIGFVEEFALATDRSTVLSQLIPGTEDFYYYHSLHFMNTEQFDKAEETLVAWAKRKGETARYWQMRTRQALITYDKNPKRSLDYLRRRFNINYPHQKEQLNVEPNLPIALDPKRISRDQFTKQALARHNQRLDGFENSALDWLIAGKLTNDQRRNLISRLTRPDYDNLTTLISADLKYKNSGGFGSFGIHRQLLQTQLDHLLILEPGLLNQQHFVQAYLTKLHPGPDEQWRHNQEQLAAYLDRLASFAAKLAPVHNSLKAHVQYHQLVFDRLQGKYSKGRFLEYIKLPRRTNYVSKEMLKSENLRRFACNLNSNYNGSTLLTAIGNDEPLVRSYLAHFFLQAGNTKEFEPYINNVYLERLFAETKIVHGLGEQEQWASLLPPEQFRQLKERVDLDFDSTNKTEYTIDAPVGLDLHIKNVSTLIVKVFEINTKSHYRTTGKEINTDINLDGLVANVELTFQYKNPPLHRIKRHFDFPMLGQAGVYIVDFIGNGQSSRALIRKGRLRHLVSTTAAGQTFTILDDNNSQVQNAAVWLAGHEYKAQKDGTIAVPFSTHPGQQSIVITAPIPQQKQAKPGAKDAAELATYSSLDHFTHSAENYTLAVDFHVDRESLLSRKTASLIIRPLLSVNGTPISTELLDDAKLIITSTNIDGTRSSQTIPDVSLFEDRESVHDFQVPPRLASVTVVLTATVKQITTGGKKVALSDSKSFTLNAIDRTDKTEDLHFLRAKNGYTLELRGRTGEPKASKPVVLSLKHHDFKTPIRVVLKTDPAGRIRLNSLTDIASVSASGPQGTAHTWNLLNNRHTYDRSVHGQAGQPLTLPYLGTAIQPQRTELSLLELRGNTFVVDRFKHLAIRDGLIVLQKLPAGDYDLFLKSSNTHIKVRLTSGKPLGSFIVGEKRQLEVQPLKPLQVESITTVNLKKEVDNKEKDDAKKNLDEQRIRIQLKNVSKFTRVHIFATRYYPEYDAFRNLSRAGGVEPYLFQQTPASSVYLTGRNIGDEYRYIIDRKYATKFPGNMLSRPSILLNPWAIRETETGQQIAQAGDRFQPKANAPKSDAKRALNKKGKVKAAAGHFANLDFLADASAVLANLIPDENGVVEFPQSLIGSHQHIHVVAIDPLNTTYRSASLEEKKPSFVDLRLLTNLDPKNHYTHQKQISIVPVGKDFILHDITTSRFEAYDNLGKVFGLYSTFGNDQAKLTEFAFILDWPSFKPEKKRELYSKFACHELNFFLFKKDSQFFKKSIQPFLKNKKDKTFMDHFLLEADLAEYLKPWKFAQLNTVERILLSRRINGEQPRTARHIADRYILLPPDLDGFISRFDTAVQQSALNNKDALGLNEATKDANRKNAFSFQNKAGGMGGGNLFGEKNERPVFKAPAKPSSELAVEMGRLEEKGSLKRRAGRGSAKELAKALDSDKNAHVLADIADGKLAFRGKKAQLRGEMRQLFRQLEKTWEWAENNYYHLTIDQQNANLISVNAFWKDFAAHNPKAAFLSTHLADASRNFPEMMFALAVLDLPFKAPKHQTKFEGSQMALTPGGPIIVFHEEIRPADAPDGATKVLVSQNFFKRGDRQRIENGEKVDKFITDEFIIHTVYGCQVVITNPTSMRQKLNVLVQIPKWALPVLGSEPTKTHHVDLQPYHTTTIEYHFYFPAAGNALQFPVHVAKNEKLIAAADSDTLPVVNRPTNIDTGSWDYISQNGTLEDVLTYLNGHNIDKINLDRIAWRMHDKNAYHAILNRLMPRHVYSQTLWSYSLLHNDPQSAREFLQHASNIVYECGGWLNSQLLVINLTERRTLEHFEYKPLVNARTHALGARRQIVNNRFAAQYHKILHDLAYRRTLTDPELLVVTYYLLLQDRVDEAINAFHRIDRNQIETKMQYDYCSAYIAFFTDKPQNARKIAEQYASHPVDRWRNTFATIIAQLDESEGKNAGLVDPENRNQQQDQLAATEPSFDLVVEGEKISLNYSNLDSVRVNFYEMDVELLFSRNPFVRQFGGQFVSIRPNHSLNLSLPKNQINHSVKIPDQLRNKNILIEVTAAGQTRTQPYFSNSLNVRLVENYGQVKVLDRKTGKPVNKAYIKVYARHGNGQVKFYKDGYTDIRGRFDYASLSTNDLATAQKFSVLVLTEKQGALVREANPPKQ